MFNHVLLLFLKFNIRFLSLLEQEIYNSSSPIWREDFNQTPEALAIPSPAGSSVTPTPSPAAGPASNASRIGKLKQVEVDLVNNIQQYHCRSYCSS